MKRRYAPLAAILLLGAAAVAATFLQIRAPLLPFDDAFINYRYVANLFHGDGLVYNKHERVFGSSTPFYVLWLSAVHFLIPGSSIPSLSIWSNALFFFAAGILLFFLLVELTENRAVAVGGSGAFLLNPVMLAISSGGMESSLFVFLMLAGLLASTTKRDVLTGVVLGIATLVRPEGAIVCAVVAIDRAREKRRLGRFLLLWALPLVVWTVFAFVYYGTPVPHSILAKAKPLYPLPFGSGLAILIRWTADWFSGRYTIRSDTFRLVIALCGLIAASLCCFLNGRARRRKAWWAPLLFWLFLLFYLIANPFVFQWYWPHLFIAGLLTSVSAVPVVIEIAKRIEKGGLRRAAVAGVWSILAFWLLISTLMPYRRGLRVSAQPSIREVADEPTRLRIIAYREVAEILNTKCPDTDTVAAPEIGALGYYYKGRVFDASGLVTPEALPLLPVPMEQRVSARTGSISEQFVRVVSPDWVVTLPVFARKSLLVSEWFHGRYRLSTTVPLPLTCFGDTEVLVFRRAAQQSTGHE